MKLIIQKMFNLLGFKLVNIRKEGKIGLDIT
jgi:hypothetical protein